MDGTDAGASKHGEARLNDHGHIDDDTVTCAHAELLFQNGGEAARLVQNFFIGPCALFASVHTVLIEADTIAMAGLDVPVEAVVREVCLSIWEPPVQVLVGHVDHSLWLLEPVDIAGLLGPELVSVIDGSSEDLVSLVVSEACLMLRVVDVIGVLGVDCARAKLLVDQA